MIDRTKYPFLYWGWRLALPYCIASWIFGVFAKLELLPEWLGEFGEALLFFFTPGMAPILVFEYNGILDVFWLLIQLASVLFVIWIFVSPLFGLFRLLIGLKN